MAHPVHSLPSFAHTFSDIPRHPHPPRTAGSKRRYDAVDNSPIPNTARLHPPNRAPSTASARSARSNPSNKRVASAPGAPLGVPAIASLPQRPSPSPRRSPSDQDTDAEDEDVIIKEEEDDPPPPAAQPTPPTASSQPQDSQTYTYPTDNDSLARKKRRVTISGSANPLLQPLNTSARALHPHGVARAQGPASAAPFAASPITPAMSPVVFGFSVPKTPSGIPSKVSVDQVRSALTLKQQQKALIEARRTNPNATIVAVLPTPPVSSAANTQPNSTHSAISSAHTVPSASFSAPNPVTSVVEHPQAPLPQAKPKSRSRAVTVTTGTALAPGMPQRVLERNPGHPALQRASSNASLRLEPPPPTQLQPSDDFSQPPPLSASTPMSTHSLLTRRKGPGGPTLGVDTTGISNTSASNTCESAGPQGWPSGISAGPSPPHPPPVRRQSSTRTPVLTVKTSGIHPPQQLPILQTQSAQAPHPPLALPLPTAAPSSTDLLSSVQNISRPLPPPQPAQVRPDVPPKDRETQATANANATPTATVSSANGKTNAGLAIPRNPALAYAPAIRSAPITVDGKMIISGNAPAGPSNSNVPLPPRSNNPFVQQQPQQPPQTASRPQVPISSTLRTPHAAQFTIPPRPGTGGHPTGLAPATMTTDKQSFLNLFGQFYDSLNDAKHLKTWLESQISNSDKLMTTLERATRESEAERARVANPNPEVLQLRARVSEMEERLARLEGRDRMDVDSTSAPQPPPAIFRGHRRTGSRQHLMDVEMHDERASVSSSSPGFVRRQPPLPPHPHPPLPMDPPTRTRSDPRNALGPHPNGSGSHTSDPSDDSGPGMSSSRRGSIVMAVPPEIHQLRRSSISSGPQQQLGRHPDSHSPPNVHNTGNAPGSSRSPQPQHHQPSPRVRGVAGAGSGASPNYHTRVLSSNSRGSSRDYHPRESPAHGPVRTTRGSPLPNSVLHRSPYGQPNRLQEVMRHVGHVHHSRVSPPTRMVVDVPGSGRGGER